MTLPLTSPFTTNSLVTKAQLDQLVASINALYNVSPHLGSASGTTNGTGYGTITHSLPFTPSRVFVQSTDDSVGTHAAIALAVVNITATTFQVFFGTVTSWGGASPNFQPALTKAYSINWQAFQ